MSEERPDPGRERWRGTTRRKAIEARAGAPRALRDVVGHRGPRPVHARRHRRPRRGSGPRAAGRAAVHPRRPGDDVPQPAVDDAPVRRLLDRAGDEQALPLPPRAGPDRPVGRVRPADPDGLRLGRAGGGGGGGPRRRPDLQPGRHGDPRRRHPAGRGLDLDDDQRDGGDAGGPVRGRGREAGRRALEGLRARSRTTSSRSTSPAARGSTRRGRRCAS